VIAVHGTVSKWMAIVCILYIILYYIIYLARSICIQHMAAVLAYYIVQGTSCFESPYDAEPIEQRRAVIDHVNT
ncbi:MAG: hypothetical protein ACI90V_001941, partial [Bacillariaceae sp.]|jgi:hypothetical protein